MQFNSAYNNKKSILSDIDQTDQISITEQKHAPFCDVNTIVANAYNNDMSLDDAESHFRDCTSDDYQEMQNKVADVKSNFEHLPANIRSAFNNDPRNLLDAMSDPTQIEHLIDLGLVELPESTSEKPEKSELTPAKSEKPEKPEKDSES